LIEVDFLMLAEAIRLEPGCCRMTKARPS